MITTSTIWYHKIFCS